MATSARELVGWTEQRWAAVQEAVNRALARTAKCRQVIPKGPELIGAKTVPVAMVTGTPLELKDDVTAPVALSVPLQFDDQHADDEPAIIRLIESAAAELGKQEDLRILSATKGTPRNAKMIPWALATAKVATNPIELAGNDATSILAAITAAVSEIEKDRPGPAGLILANDLLAVLRQPVRAGEAPPLNQAEQLIGTSEIVGTSALDKAGKGVVCGILFRVEPGAMDLVHTQLPTVTVLERTGGKTKLSVEEEIALRVLDDKAIVRIKTKP
jgi:uncharacterized linocin/CFP29 family protein